MWRHSPAQPRTAPQRYLNTPSGLCTLRSAGGRTLAPLAGAAERAGTRTAGRARARAWTPCWGRAGGGADPASGGRRGPTLGCGRYPAICGARRLPQEGKEAREDVRGVAPPRPVQGASEALLVLRRGGSIIAPKVRSEGPTGPGPVMKRRRRREKAATTTKSEGGWGWGVMRHSLSVPDPDPEPEWSRNASAHAPRFATIFTPRSAASF